MTRRPALVAFALAGALTLTACAPAATPEAEPVPTQPLVVGSTHTPEPEPTTSATPDPTPTVIETEPRTAPECTGILDTAWLQENIDDRLDDGREYHTFAADGLPGPVARKAFASSEVLRACGWGIPQSDGGFGVAVLTITPEAEAELDAALAASSVYTADHGHSRSIYSRTLDDGINWGFAQGFDSGYWVVTRGTMIDPGTAALLTGLALDTLTRR